MTTGDRTRVIRARRLLIWGPALLGLALTPLTLPLEQDVGLRLLFGWRGGMPPPDDVIIVGIDERTEQDVGRPIDRAMHAAVIDALADAGASTIVFDVFLHDPSRDDQTMSSAIHRAGNVVLTALLERDNPGGMDRQTLRTPVAALSEHAVGTAPWIVPETFRVDWAILRDGSDAPTVPLVALQAHLHQRFMALLTAARPQLGARFSEAASSSRPLPVTMRELRRAFAADPALGQDLLRREGAASPGIAALVSVYERDDAFRSNRLYINYYGPPRTISTVPYQDALAGTIRDHDGRFEGKVVFVGYTARRQPGQRDHHPYVFSVDGFNLSGVEMGATVFANLLHGTSLTLPSLLARALLVTLWGLVVAAGFRRLRVRPGIAAGALLFAGYLTTAAMAFRLENLWLPIAVPAIQFLFAGTLSVRVKQLTDRAQLGIGTSEEAVLALTGRSKPEKVDHRVILFADEKGSKKRLKRELTELDLSQRRALQREFAFARDIPVTDNGGHINHTFADSMLAYWVTPHPDDDEEVSDRVAAACRAALAIHARLQALNQRYPGFALSMRTGLDWGEISSRLNPSPHIKDWKMVGTPIHAAERLESLNKLLGTSTLVSHAVARHLRADEFDCMELGTFVFCDDSGDIVVDPVRVHELRPTQEATASDRRHAGEFTAALDALRRRDWDAGIAWFRRLASSGHRHSALAARYADWCTSTQQEPDSRWRGVVVVTFSDKSQYLDRFL